MRLSVWTRHLIGSRGETKAGKGKRVLHVSHTLSNDSAASCPRGRSPIRTEPERCCRSRPLTCHRRRGATAPAESPVPLNSRPPCVGFCSQGFRPCAPESQDTATSPWSCPFLVSLGPTLHRVGSGGSPTPGTNTSSAGSSPTPRARPAACGCGTLG